MKIFVASIKNEVAARLGKSDEFHIYEVEDRKVINKEVVKNPGNDAKSVTSFLLANGCDILLCGGLGDSALRILATNGVRIGVGASGNCDDIINKLLSDLSIELEARASHGCCHHEEHHCCGGHHHECCEGDDDECCCHDEEDCCCHDEDECCSHDDEDCCSHDDDECCCCCHK